MLVAEVMTSPVVTVRDTATLKQAIQLLEKHSITAMPVLDGSARLVGVVSEADVIREVVLPDQRAHEIPIGLTAAPFRSRVADVMSTHLLTVTSETELAKAAELLTSTVVKSLPVVDHGEVVGILSRGDIVRVLARRDQRIEADVEELCRQAGKDWLVDVDEGIVALQGPSSASEERLAQALVRTVPGVVGVHVKVGRSA